MRVYCCILLFFFFTEVNSFYNSHIKKVSILCMTKKLKAKERKYLKEQEKRENTHCQNNNGIFYEAKTPNQELYVNYLNNEETKLIIITGPAGTGKTLFACQKAIMDLKNSVIDKIIITRPIVPVEEDIGFLPGNIKKKMEPWLKPIYDIFLNVYSKNELESMLNNEIIEICPLAFMRGRTFKNAFIIADEMQNSSPNQMIMLSTRLGDNSRMVITGDLQQTDIKRENGLHNIIDNINKYKRYEEDNSLIKHVSLDAIDIERSEITKKIIEIYNYNSSNSYKYVKSNVIYDLKNEKYEINTPTDIPTDTSINENEYADSDAALMPKHQISASHETFIKFMKF